MLKKKKEIVIPVWEREQEYQLLYAKMSLAKAEYLNYEGHDEALKAELKAEWLELEKVFTPLYEMRECWMDKTGVRPKKVEKEKLSKEAKVTIGVTAGSLIIPPLIENRGIIMRNAKDIWNKSYNLLLGVFKRR